MGRICHCLILIIIGLGLIGCDQRIVEPQSRNDAMVLDYNFGTKPLLFDPVLAVEQASLDLSVQLFDNLVQFDSESGQILPALAEDWDISQDGLTYTFKMREDAIWVNQKGEPQREVTALDVVYAIKRGCDPNVASPYSYMLFGIQGCQSAHESVSQPDLEHIGVRELAPFIVEFTLNRPLAYFPTILSMPIARPVPHEVVEAYGDQWTNLEHLLTNGPFRLDEWQANDHLTLIKNPHFYEANDVQLMQIKGHFLDDVTASNHYLENKIDAMNVESNATRHLRSMSSINKEWTPFPEPCTYAYGFTMVKPPLDNVRVRRALSMALDRQKLIDQVQEMQLPARHFAPPFVFGALPLDKGGASLNLPMAQQLLAEAGYPAGQGFPPLFLVHPEHPVQAQLATMAAEMWLEHLGIEVIAESMPREAYVAMIQRTTPLDEMSHIWALGWCADYPDQHNWIYQVFNLEAEPLAEHFINRRFEERITVYGGGEYVRRIAGRLDDLTEEAMNERDQNKRQALYQEAERILTVEETIIAPVYHDTINTFTKPWVQRTYSYVKGQSFKKWVVDMEAKTEALNRGQ